MSAFLTGDLARILLPGADGGLTGDGGAQNPTLTTATLTTPRIGGTVDLRNKLNAACIVFGVTCL
jgi:hypothetical protein